MGRNTGLVFAAVLALGAVLGHACMAAAPTAGGEKVTFEAPIVKGALSVEEAIAARRSVRLFSDKPVTMAEVGQLLWAAQGVTEKSRGLRAAPSAGALYPLEVYAVMPEGLYKYVPGEHAVVRVKEGDRRAALAEACMGQKSVSTAGACVVISSVYERTAVKYGGRAKRYADFEAGCAAENLFLQATSMGIASAPVGAFDDSAVRQVIGFPSNETPVIVIPLGRPAE